MDDVPAEGGLVELDVVGNGGHRIQLEENVEALDNTDFAEEELAAIDRHATDSEINLWAESSRD